MLSDFDLRSSNRFDRFFGFRVYCSTHCRGNDNGM